MYVPQGSDTLQHKVSVCFFGKKKKKKKNEKEKSNPGYHEGIGGSVVQCIQAKISKTLDKRSTLIFGANCTEQKLSSSESYHLSPNL